MDISSQLQLGNQILDLAGNASREDGLRVQGVACTIFEGDLDLEELVISWQGDTSVTTDRYDARLLLESLEYARAAINK